MALKSIQMEFAGQAGVSPRLGRMVTTDNLAAITTAGYLNNNSNATGINFSASDFIFVNYDAPLNGTGGSTGMFTFSIDSQGIITLVVPTSDVPAFVQGVTPGTSAASKALSLDGSSNLNGVAIANITASGTYNAALTATAAEANLNHLQTASVTTVSTTPASGSCAAQFQFKNAAAGNIAAVTPFLMYVSDVSGDLSTAVSGITALTNGVLVQLVTGRNIMGTTNATGQIGITLSGSAGTYYVTFLLPNGKTAISSALVVNA